MPYILCKITSYRFYSVSGEMSLQLRTIQKYALRGYAAFTDLMWLFLIHFAECDKLVVLSSKLLIRLLMYKIPSLSKYWHSIPYAKHQNGSLDHYREHRTEEQLCFLRKWQFRWQSPFVILAVWRFWYDFCALTSSFLKTLAIFHDICL